MVLLHQPPRGSNHSGYISYTLLGLAPKTGVLSLRDKLLNLDIIGKIFLIGAAVMLFISIEYTAQGNPWSSTQVVGLMIGFSAMAVIFITWQWYMQGKALIPPSITKKRTVAASSAITFVVYGAMLLHAYFLPIWSQTVRGETALQSEVNMLPYFTNQCLFFFFLAYWAAPSSQLSDTTCHQR